MTAQDRCDSGLTPARPQPIVERIARPAGRDSRRFRLHLRRHLGHLVIGGLVGCSSPAGDRVPRSWPSGRRTSSAASRSRSSSRSSRSSFAIIFAVIGALGRLSDRGADLRRGDAVRVARPRHAADRPDHLHLPGAAAVFGSSCRRSSCGIFALAFNYGAYMTEIFRAGIQAIPRGQSEAAAALGMTDRRTHAPDRPAAGDPDRHPRHRQRVHRDDQGLRARVASSASRSCSGGRAPSGSAIASGPSRRW